MSATRIASSNSTTRAANGRSHGPKRHRALARAVHLLAAAVIGTYIYAAAAVAAPLHLILAFAVIPVAAVTGLFLAYQAQIRRNLRRFTVLSRPRPAPPT